MKTNQLAAAVAVVLGLAGFSGGAAAQSNPSATGSVTANVAVTFTAKCQLSSASSTVAVDFGAYSAFAADVSAAQQTVNYECSRGLGAPTFKWDSNPNGSTVQGTVKGLRYQLTASSAKSTTGVAPVLTGTPTNGTPDIYDIKVDGTLYSGAGDPTGSPTASNTLVFTF